MLSAVACAMVPKITVLIGGSHGPDSYAMVRQRDIFCDFFFLTRTMNYSRHLLLFKGVNKREVM